MLELVRYIHLNPLRARLVADYEELCEYPHGGHSVILGEREWQDDDYILGLFDGKRYAARRDEVSCVPISSECIMLVVGVLQSLVLLGR